MYTLVKQVYNTLRGLKGCIARTEYARRGKSIQLQLVNLGSGALQSTSDSSKDVSFLGYYKPIPLYALIYMRFAFK